MEIGLFSCSVTHHETSDDRGSKPRAITHRSDDWAYIHGLDDERSALGISSRLIGTLGDPPLAVPDGSLLRTTYSPST